MDGAMTEAREGQWRGLYQHVDWRARWGNGEHREQLKAILNCSNPVFPIEQQYPQAYAMAPTAKAMRTYRDALRASLQARADVGDALSLALLPWLTPDPLEEVREVLDEFIAGHDPHTFPTPPAPGGRWVIPPYSYSGQPEWREP